MLGINRLLKRVFESPQLKKIEKELDDIRKQNDFMKTLLLSYVFENIKENLVDSDSATRDHNSDRDIETARMYWNRAKRKVAFLKNNGFTEDVKNFIKSEGRTKKLMEEPRNTVK